MAWGARNLISTQDFENAARALGVVNQKNVLWDHLSCRDHLSLFARLRGVDIEGDARHAAEQAPVSYTHLTLPTNREV